MAVTGRIPTITSSASTSGNTGTTPSITVTANFAISNLDVSGEDLEIASGVVRPVQNTVAGAYTGTLTATGGNNMQATQDVTITLNSVALTLLPPTNIAFSNITTTSFDIAWTAAAGATSYQVRIDSGTPVVFISGGTMVVAVANRTYNVQVRSSDGTNFSAWSTVQQVTTLEIVVDPPGDGTTPRRLAEINAAMCLQGHYNWANANSPHGSDWDNPNGWLHKYAGDLATEGVRRVRSAFGINNAARTIARAAYSDHGMFFEGALSDARDATGPDSPNEILAWAQAQNRYVVNGTFIIHSVQGLNEPNNPNKSYGVNYRQDTMRAMTQMLDSMDANAIWDDVYRLTFSPWGRQHYVHKGLRFADGEGDWRSQTTDPGPVSTAPYVWQGKTWDEDVFPRVDAVNLHLYTGGREPTIAGMPLNVKDENGSNVDIISLDDTLHQLRCLAGATPYWSAAGENRKLEVPYSCTEGGWHHQGPNHAIATKRNSWAYVTDNVQAKYNLRSHFEHMLRGMGTDYHNHYVWYEFLDHPTGENIYGAIAYTQAGAVFTYNPRPVYYAQLYLARACKDLAGNSRTFNVQELDFTLSNPPGQSNQYTSKIHHLLFQRSDGVWFLIIWFDHESWNRTINDPRGLEDFESRNVRLRFNDGNKKVRSYRPYNLQNPNNSSSWTTYNSFSPSAFVDLVVPDDPLIVQITP